MNETPVVDRLARTAGETRPKLAPVIRPGAPVRSPIPTKPNKAHPSPTTSPAAQAQAPKPAVIPAPAPPVSPPVVVTPPADIYPATPIRTPTSSTPADTAPSAAGQPPPIVTSTPPPNIYFGYADNYFTHGVPEGLPWLGMTNTLVLGCGVNPNGGGPAPDVCPTDATDTAIDSYDGGAIRLDNVAASPLVVTGASVQIGTCSYNPWPGLNISITPGATLVLTETGGPNPCGTAVVGNYNFDTSESFFPLTDYVDGSNLACTPDTAVPVVTLTTSQGTITINDTGQILNTGGIDPLDCSVNTNEFHAFTQVYP